MTPPSKIHIRRYKKILFCIGMLLLLLNITGLFLPLRYNNLQHENPNEIIISRQTLLQTATGEYSNPAIYLQQLNAAVHNAICHNWDDNNIDRYHLRIPVWENYILWSLSYLYPAQFLKYEFTDYHKAIDRGVGLCSQHAIILDSLLDKKGIKSKIVKLSGHVVVTALADENENTWWILDPDFGVILKYDLTSIENNTSLIYDAYLKQGYDISLIKKLMDIYGPQGNEVVSDVKNYVPERFFAERTSYILIWLIPILCMLPLSSAIIRSRKERSTDQ